MTVTPYSYLIFYEATERELIVPAIRNAARDPSGMTRLFDSAKAVSFFDFGVDTNPNSLSAGLDPAVHVFLVTKKGAEQTWVAGSSPATGDT
ncbi:MAG: hypothetical protein AB7H71_16875 [Alphaproteobacteria bacterium]